VLARDLLNTVLVERNWVEREQDPMVIVLDALKDGHSLIIFPEGTRRPPGAPPDYKTGIILLYDALGVPCLPVALNSGLFWPRRSVIRRPGTIVVEILPPIPPGLPRDEFLRRLEAAVEGASGRLLVEGGAPEPARA